MPAQQAKWVEKPIAKVDLKIAEVEVNEAVRNQAVDHSDIHRELYVWADRMRPMLKEHAGIELPQIALALEHGRKDRLGWYVIGKCGLQLSGRVTLNARYINRPFCFVLITLAHECCHYAEELLGKQSKSKNSSYHAKWFRSLVADLGFPCDQKGRLTITQIDPDSPFGKLLTKHNIPLVGLHEGNEGDDDADGNGGNGKDGGGDREKGKSTLKKWSCGCTNIRAAVQIKALCLLCRNKFERNDPFAPSPAATGVEPMPDSSLPPPEPPTKPRTRYEQRVYAWQEHIRALIERQTDEQLCELAVLPEASTTEPWSHVVRAAVHTALQQCDRGKMRVTRKGTSFHGAWLRKTMARLGCPVNILGEYVGAIEPNTPLADMLIRQGVKLPKPARTAKVEQLPLPLSLAA